MTVTVAAFYKFTHVADPAALQADLLRRADSLGVRGTILIAPEGINGTISAPPPAMTEMLATMRADPRFANLETKETPAAGHPFGKLKVKVKREILTFHRPEADPTIRVGAYVEPEDWNALITAPDVILIDTRNSYEVEAGTFEGAVDPKTRRFTEFPDYVAANLDPAKHKRVAMFCTGGIRCEKATAYMLAHGFREVYHLRGGILNYLKRIPQSDSLWRGDCFVFDERSTVDHSDA